MTPFLFYLFAALLLGASLFVVLNRNPMYSVVALVFGFANLAAIYFLLEAYFIGALQVLVYAGAIMVLFMFVIMLLNLKDDDKIWKVRERNIWLFSLTGAMMVGVLYKIIDITAGAEFNSPAKVPDEFGTVEMVGTALFTDFVLPFEVASILLLVAMVGSVVLAKSKVD